MAIMLTPRLPIRFLADRRASIVPFFALAIIPVIGFMGAAVDYSRGNSVKSAMQAALDATGLMLSKEAGSLTASEITQKANQYFQAVFNRPEAKNIQITPILKALNNGGYQLDISSMGFVDTTFTRVIGQTQMKVTATTQIVWGFKKLELALALDNTGSMSSSGKMTALKQASHSLVKILKKASQKPGDIKISLIPFDTMVNIGTSYKNKKWFDWDEIDCNGNQSGNGCSGNSAKNFWGGCVMDRASPFFAQDTKPSSSNPATLYPGVNDCGTLAEAMPLTSDWNALDKRIDEMKPNGNTNVPIGLVWAWHSLTSSVPYNEAAASDPELDKVILILTDGENTEAWDNQTNKTITSQNTIDNRTTTVCNNVKAAGIKIYSVRVIEGNASLLKSCASNPSMYFDVKQASELDAVFQSIAEALANLRIAK
jgi:Flp pilus assembly protein TadG